METNIDWSSLSTAARIQAYESTLLITSGYIDFRGALSELDGRVDATQRFEARVYQDLIAEFGIPGTVYLINQFR